MTSKRGMLLAAVTSVLVASTLVIGCGGGAAPAPTAAPAKPAAAEPTKAPAAAAPTQAAAAAPAATKAPEAPARAEGYFKGKTVNVILPNSPGKGNDTTLRYVLPFIQEVAGAQAMPVENLAGAGGMLGFNKAYASKDAFTWGAGSVASSIVQQLSEQDGVRWDVTKVSYLGRFYSEPRLLLAPAKTTIKTVDDALKLGRPLNLPIQGLDEDNMGMFMALNFLGLKGKLITGYQGESDVFLAAMRGEGDWVMSAQTTATPMIKNGDMIPVMVIGSERSKQYPDVPAVTEVLKDPSQKESMTAVTNIMQLLISLWLPPNTDPKVVAEARYVVAKGLTGDPKLAADMPAKTGGRELAYMSGEDLQAKVNQIMTQSSKLVPLLKQAAESVK